MAGIFKNIPETFNIPKGCRESFLPLDAGAAQPLRSRGLILAGLSELVAPFAIGRPNPPFIVLLYTLAGSARCRTAAGESTLRPGELWLCPAHQAHLYWVNRHWRLAWCHLRAEALPALAQPQCRHSRFGTRIAAAMEGLVEETLRFERDACSAASAYAEILGVHLERDLNGLGDLPGAQRLDALWAEVNANLAAPWRGDTLAARVHVSAATLHRLTTRLYGKSPLEMVGWLRLRRAQQLLRGGEFGLRQIAAQLGYATAFAFSRFFKRAQGCSPRDYRHGLEH